MLFQQNRQEKWTKFYLFFQKSLKVVQMWHKRCAFEQKMVLSWKHKRWFLGEVEYEENKKRGSKSFCFEVFLLLLHRHFCINGKKCIYGHHPLYIFNS